MGGAALSIIQGWSKPMNVMKIEGEEGKTVYAMTGVQWGLYKDSQEKSTKYWYFGPLKQRISYIIKTMQGWPQFIRSDFSSTVPCTGCNKCVTAIPKKPSIWSWLFGWWRKTEEVIDYSQINNEECGIWNEMKISSVEFTASTTNTDPLLQGISEIKVDLGIEEMSRSDFIKEGWARMKDKNNKDTEERIERTKMSVGEFKLTPIIDKDQENWFYIDSEKFEVMSIHASLLKNKINFFTNIH
ncbi:acylglycerol kinase, mitochondrial-like [Saccoglossus kowalevskii]|uniref:Acylglycerol kinase, mitochondrial-like n=1 Tax=Saccoglossus kowalevskii TaxID=10224 RepID=A0ABM0MHL9_SACKO|nr:PREDICTED: acylglycerol kinase, mitochondrial-like [Saccoglossus kowalevskii]